MTTVSHEMRTDAHHETLLDEGLLDAAQYMIDHPRQREILSQFMSGEIHEKLGGSIVTQRGQNEPPIVYWHDHGTFVAPDGSIYQPRTDDYDIHRQMFMSAVDGRGSGFPCIQPYTYDGYTGPHSISMRFDFVNGKHRCAPQNTPEEAALLHREGRDPVAPRHKEWVASDRDSLSLKKFEDGHIEGVLHDSVTNTDTKLYSPEMVMAAVSMLDDIQADIDGLTGDTARSRQQIIARYLGDAGVAGANLGE